MKRKQAGPDTKRPIQGECCTHIDVGGHSVRQLRLLLLDVLPGQQGGRHRGEGSSSQQQRYVCINCKQTAQDGFQEAGSDCDHSICLDTHRLELHCRCCKDYVYLEAFDEALLLACQQLMQQTHPNGSLCSIPINDPGPALLSKRQRLLVSTPSPEPGCNNNHRGSNASSQTDIEAAAAAAAGAGGSEQQQAAAALAAAGAGSWEACVAPDGFPLGLRGLNNLGNTCFMNSILQVMLHAPLLRSFYLGEGHDPGSCRLTARAKPCLSCQMDAVFGEVYSGNRQPYSPAEFLYQWWRFADSLAGYQQQDAHEFYLSLLEGLSGSVLCVGPPAAAAAVGGEGARDSPGSHQQQQQQGQQQQQQGQAGSGAAVVPGSGVSSRPISQGVDVAYLNVLGGSLAPAAALTHTGLQQQRLNHPALAAGPGQQQQQHTDPLPPLQLDQPQQQAGSSGYNGWSVDPTVSQQQQHSGPPGELSGYETPISSGATPEPEGDTEAASRPPEQGPAALVDLVFSGLLRSDVRCCACGHTSTAHDPFRDVSLDLHVPRPPRLPPAQPHHRPPPQPAAATAAAAATAGTPGARQAPGHQAAGVVGSHLAEEASPAVAAAAKRLGISGPLVAGGEGVDLLGLREATPPLVVGMTPSPTPPPSELLMEYWGNNEDNERDTAAGGVGISRPGSARDLQGAAGASQATSASRQLSAATGLEDEDDEGEGDGRLSTALSGGGGGEEDEVLQQQQQQQDTTAGGLQAGLTQTEEAAAAAVAAARPGLSGKGDALSIGTQGASLTPEPMSESPEHSERGSEKSPGASEVGGPVASQSSQQVGGLRVAGGQREPSPELDPPATGLAVAPGSAAAQQLQRQGGGVADMRESTPQSQATQPNQQQQQQGFELPPATHHHQQQQQGMQQQQQPEAVLVGLQAVAADQQQQHQHQHQQGGADGVLPVDAAAAAGSNGVSSLVRGVSGGLSQLVKGPMTAIKQTAIKLLPAWGAPGTGEEHTQQQQQQYTGMQIDLQHQQPDQVQPQDQQQQQQMGSLPAAGGYPGLSGHMGHQAAGHQQYNMAAGQYDMQQAYAQQQSWSQDQTQQPYDPQQQQQMYLEGWSMQHAYDGSTVYNPAAYDSSDWMQQQSQMYAGSGYVDAAAAAALAAAAAGSSSRGGAKSGKAAAGPKPARVTRCGKCKYCLNRHLKKGCEANKKLREEAKAAAKAQARLAADDRAAVQRAAAQRAAQSIAATAAAENDPAAAAAQPVFDGPAAAVGGGGVSGSRVGPTQPTHPLRGMQVQPGAAAGAGWAHPAGGVVGTPLYQQQQYHPGASYYAQQQQQQHARMQMQPAAGAAAGFQQQQQQQHPQQQPLPGAVPNSSAKPSKPSKSASSAQSKVLDRLVTAAMTAGLLKKRDERGRFYRKEHLQTWAHLLYKRGQITTPGLPPVTAEAAAAAAAVQEAAMSAGTAEWPLPPWMQPQETAATIAAAAAAAPLPARPSSAPPALKASGQGSKVASAPVKKGSSTAGAASSKKAQPAVLRMNDLSLPGCLRRYVRPERLGSAAHWRCTACGSSTAALKQLSFRRLPLVLCFHVKRFEHGGAAQRPRKLDVPMRFPLHGLDMAPFTTSHMLRGQAQAQHARPAPEPGSNAAAGQAGSSAGEAAAAAAVGADVGGSGEGPSFRQNCLYELFGVVSHWGDMTSGHYVSYVKCDGAWYLINDPWVVAVSEADVAGVQAYMLFYAQEHLFGTGSSGELAEAQRRQRAEAAAAVVAAAASASAKAAAKAELGGATGAAGVKAEPGVVGAAGAGAPPSAQPVVEPPHAAAGVVKAEPAL